MKIKIQILLTLLLASLSFCACSDDDKDEGISVPPSISKALQEKYPAATRVKWEMKGQYYVADCWMDTKEMDVWFDKNATWRLTEVDIAWNDLPSTVQTGFMNGEFAGWEREDIDRLEYPLQPVQFVIEVEQGNTEYQLFYSQDGNLLQKRDVSGKDSTHWPIN